jgi:hypothetical protein
MARLICHTCGAPTGYDEPIPRDSTCEKCGTDLRCCRNCRHWDVRYSNECTETQADPVPDKTRRNFCEFFYFSRAEFSGKPGGGKDRAAEARAKLEAMFGGAKPPPPSVPGDTRADPVDLEVARKAEARARLEKLFGKADGGSGG